MSNIEDTPERNEPDRILPDVAGEEAAAQPTDGSAERGPGGGTNVHPVGDGENQPETPGDHEPRDTRGRSYPKSDGNPFVTGDVRST